jgi:hydroxyacylglutathione hydrolase
MSNFKIHYIRAFTDNYIWFVANNKEIILIDPGDATAIIPYITTHNLYLKAILITHDHADHIGGINALTNKFTVPIYGDSEYANIKVTDNSIINLDNISITCISTPGHTFKAISYLIALNGNQHLFCGDTLFAAGCGRVFTKDYELMLRSLSKINQLDDTTLIYPAHEYTQKNLAFALQLMPDNKYVKEQINDATMKLNIEGNSLPTTLKNEKQVNPFLCSLRYDFMKLMHTQLDKSINTHLDCFIALRKLRDQF